MKRRGKRGAKSWEAQLLQPRAEAAPAAYLLSSKKERRGKEEDKDEEEGKAGEKEQKSAVGWDGKIWNPRWESHDWKSESDVCGRK